MINVSLLGKKYQDQIFSLEKFQLGETNLANSPIQQLGGGYNLLKAKSENINFIFKTSGSKNAIIINESATSSRTSIVTNQSICSYNKSEIHEINKSSDWAHICYLDDIEDTTEFLNLKINFSVDFCTLTVRETFKDIIDKATVIFDSRERKKLYKQINTKTPIIFHDQSGVEVIVNKEKIFESQIKPILNLNVNGAGDIYAANFIKNYNKYGIIKSTHMAMIATTNLLKEGNNK